MKAFAAALVLASSLLTPSTVVAQVGDDSPDYDVRVEEALEGSRYDWEIDSDGDFRMILEFDDNRSHVLFVNSATNHLGGMEVREVWAVGATSDEGFSATVMEALLRESANVKLGGWSIQDMGSSELAIFRAQVSANASAGSLSTIIMAVATTADEFEKELLGSDEL
ncbi:hypothetical protein [Pseudidiomarina sediminum]|uniref:hypothetical protein n=1 Tax=Pseudidiomarina sediminum TaxID=431675 RepID=UPI001C94F8C3|nr:hypothetical protein [Pseudidiomarina sediminum]MBY6064587.1 hypothetical protein [Pseudidiomarina sediminum]